MAAAIGRLTGTPGVVLVTSGPGTTNLATGLLTANTEQDPVGGPVRRGGPGGPAQTNAPIDGRRRTDEDGHQVHRRDQRPDNAPEAVANAFRAATTAPQGAAAVILPQDVLARATGAGLQRVLPTPLLGAAPAEAINKAANLFGKRSGRHCWSAPAAPTRRAAPRCGPSSRPPGCRWLETFQAAGVVSRVLEDHYLGRVGLFRNQPGDVVLANADVLVAVGYDAVEYDPVLLNADVERTIVHMTPSPPMWTTTISRVGVARSVAATLDELTPLLSDLILADGYVSALAHQRQLLTDIDEYARSASAKVMGSIRPRWCWRCETAWRMTPPWLVISARCTSTWGAHARRHGPRQPTPRSAGRWETHGDELVTGVAPAM